MRDHFAYRQAGKVSSSWSVKQGAKSNRVRSAKKPSRARTLVPTGSARRFAKDPTTHGKLYTVVCISIPIEELAVIDDAADRAHMARSRFLALAGLEVARRG